MKETGLKLLANVNIKATPNRILVVDALLNAKSPMSLIELERKLQTLDRSSVLRVLDLLLDRDIVHIMEDGRGITKYEICPAGGHCSMDDMHVHFYCKACGNTYCFEEQRIPHISIPKDYEIQSANFMLKGICPKCSGCRRD